MADANKIAAIQSLVDKSGNKFHCEVIRNLNSKSWITLVSPYYMDNAANKPREIDLIAEKSFQVSTYNGREYKPGTINLQLFIECKYIKQENVFWFAKKDIQSAGKIVKQQTNIDPENQYAKRIHQLFDNKVAKLFVSKNSGELESETIYKALNQSLNAMTYLRRKISTIVKESDHRNFPIFHNLIYPVILCNSFDNFYKVDMEDNSSPPEQITDSYFQLEVEYAYKVNEDADQLEYFLIDIVNYQYFDDYLSIIQNNVKQVAIRHGYQMAN